MESYEIIWKTVLPELEKSISTISYRTYIKPLKPVDVVGETIVLMTSSNIYAQMVKSPNLKERILRVFREKELPIKDMEVFVGDSIKQYQAHKVEQVDAPPIETQPLNQDFTFENFVVGNSNRYLFSASKAVAENPGNNYNPLFIYGASGLGKTHMMHAIANYVNKTQPKKKVLYATCERFMSDLIQNIRSGKAYNPENKELRNRYRSVDVLIIDDVQALAKGRSSQEEFFNTFNELYASNKQIILSADCEPNDIELLDERLKTRFNGGLKAQVLPPDIETKIAIVQKKGEMRKQIIGLDVATFIAENSSDDVRSLEGMLNKVIFSSILEEKPITLQLAQEAIASSVQTENKEAITTSKIIDAVCSYYKVKKSELVSKKRNKEVAEARQVCAYLMTELMSIPLVTIGQSLGGRNYATIIHSRDKVAELINISDRVATEVNDIKNLILKK